MSALRREQEQLHTKVQAEVEERVALGQIVEVRGLTRSISFMICPWEGKAELLMQQRCLPLYFPFIATMESVAVAHHLFIMTSIHPRSFSQGTQLTELSLGSIKARSHLR